MIRFKGRPISNKLNGTIELNTKTATNDNEIVSLEAVSTPPADGYNKDITLDYIIGFIIGVVKSIVLYIYSVLISTLCVGRDTKHLNLFTKYKCSRYNICSIVYEVYIL